MLYLVLAVLVLLATRVHGRVKNCSPVEGGRACQFYSDDVNLLYAEFDKTKQLTFLTSITDDDEQISCKLNPLDPSPMTNYETVWYVLIHNPW